MCRVDYFIKIEVFKFENKLVIVLVIEQNKTHIKDHNIAATAMKMPSFGLVSFLPWLRT